MLVPVVEPLTLGADFDTKPPVILGRPADFLIPYKEGCSRRKWCYCIRVTINSVG